MDAVARRTWLHAVRMQREAGLPDARELQMLDYATRGLAENSNPADAVERAENAIMDFHNTEHQLHQDANEFKCASTTTAACCFFIAASLWICVPPWFEEEDRAEKIVMRIFFATLCTIAFVVGACCSWNARRYDPRPTPPEMHEALEQARRTHQEAIQVTVRELREENETLLGAPLHAVAVVEEVDAVMEKV